MKKLNSLNYLIMIDDIIENFIAGGIGVNLCIINNK